MIEKRIKKKYFKRLKKAAKKYLKKTFSIKQKKFNKLVAFSIKNIIITFNICIRITPNNIFCVLRDNIKNQTVILVSGGLIKIKISKKKLKFINKLFIETFISKIEENVKGKTCLVKISGPKKIIRFVSKQIIKSLKKSKLLINVLNKKVFNGCRAKKIRRKKRKGMRVFK